MELANPTEYKLALEHLEAVLDQLYETAHYAPDYISKDAYEVGAQAAAFVKTLRKDV